jgi:hypothetical protein
MAKFEYLGKDRSSEDVAKRAKGGGDFDSFLTSEVTTFKPKEGTNKVRILPPGWSKEDAKIWGADWSIDIYLHYSVGPDDTSYLCPAKMNVGRCPICEARADMEEDEAEKLRPARRALAYVINRDNEREGPMIWSIPVTLLKEIATRSQNKKTGGILYIDDPDNGHDVEFERDGTDIKTKYSGVDIDKEETSIAEDDKTYNRWLDYIMDHPLPEVLNFYDAEYLEKALFGKKTKRNDDDDDRSSSRRGGRDRSGGESGEKDDDRSSRRSGRERDDDRASNRRGGRDRAGDGEPDAEPDDERSSRRSGRDDGEKGEPRDRRGGKDDPETERPRERVRLNREKDPEPDPDEDPDTDASDSAKSALERVRNRRRSA